MEEKSVLKKLYVGIDMSLNSPGVAVLRTDSIETRHVLCFQQLKREKIVHNLEITPHFFLTVCQYDHDANQWTKIWYVVKTIIEFIESFEFSDIQIGIENYAFSFSNQKLKTKRSSSVTKMAEVGGILRNEMAKRNWKWSNIVCSSAKKVWCGNGKAEKSHMVRAYHERKYPDLTKHVLIKPNGNPMEDICDALSILQCLYQIDFPLPKPVKVKKNRKNEVTVKKRRKLDDQKDRIIGNSDIPIVI